MFDKFIGIDISKDWADIDLGDKVYHVLESAFDAFVKEHLCEFKGALCVMESTGGYECRMVRVLQKHGIKVHIAHPNKVLSFMKARGKLAKTDRTDARMLSAFGAFMRKEDIRAPLSEDQIILEKLGARLTQLKAMLHEEQCRLVHPETDKFLKQSVQQVMKIIQDQIKIIEGKILEKIKNKKELNDIFDILRSMKGIGDISALTIITDLPEIGQLTKKEVAALVGVAPITKDSGKKKGQACIRFGRFQLRKVMYMAALTACRSNPVMRSFYQRLCDKGRPKKVAIIAVLRKMIITLNAMVKTKTKWMEIPVHIAA